MKEKIKEEKLLQTNRRWSDNGECIVDYYSNDSNDLCFNTQFSFEVCVCFDFGSYMCVGLRFG